MNKKSKLRLIGIFYFGIILLFGVVYWVLWLQKPSNFIINSEYNEHTIEPFYFYEDLDTLKTKHSIISAKETNEKIAPYYDSINIIRHIIHENAKTVKFLRQKDSLNSINQNLFFTKKMNDEVKESAKKFQPKIDSLNSRLSIENLKQQKIDKNTQEYFDNQVVIAKLKLAISVQELELNRQKLKVYNKDFSSFYSDSLKKAGLNFSAQIDSIEDGNNSNLEKIYELTEIIRLNVVDYYLGQMDKVGLIDFAYFSIITATSTGYGDILPNSTFVRILVSFEILISLFLFGFFFYYIAKPNQDNK
jgi:voltage-gated potassium channel